MIENCHKDKRLCKCGCGELINVIDIRGRPRFWKFGHNTKGQFSHWWIGGRIRTQEGYIWIYSPNHPRRNSVGYVKEHRLIWERHNKAMLLPWAIVHHINGIKDDNRIENLEILTMRKHRIYHLYEAWKDDGWLRNHPRFIKAKIRKQKRN